jgi:hypothetical protein
MSKKILLAKDLLPGDKIRLVYEIEIDDIGDLDTKYPSESENLYYISGKVFKGPLHKKNVEVEFAISGDDKVTVTKRKSFWSKVKDRLSHYRGEMKPPRIRTRLPSKSSGAMLVG